MKTFKTYRISERRLFKRHSFDKLFLFSTRFRSCNSFGFLGCKVLQFKIEKWSAILKKRHFDVESRQSESTQLGQLKIQQRDVANRVEDDSRMNFGDKVGQVLVQVSDFLGVTVCLQSTETSFLEFRASLLNLELEHFATQEAQRIARSEMSRKEKQFIEAVTFEQASFGNSVSFKCFNV